MNIHHTTMPDSFCTTFEEWMNHINFQSFILRHRNRTRENLLNQIAPKP